MTRGLSVVVAALLVCAGCSADQKGAAPPPPAAQTASAAPTRSPTPTASATPFVSTADEAGAFAFTREYLNQLDRAFATGNLEQIKPLRKDECLECLELERRVNDVYATGGRIAGSHISVESLALGQSGPAFAKVTAAIKGSRGSTTDQQGVVTENPASKGAYYLLLVRAGDHWQVQELRGNVEPSPT